MSLSFTYICSFPLIFFIRYQNHTPHLSMSNHRHVLEERHEFFGGGSDNARRWFAVEVDEQAIPIKLPQQRQCRSPSTVFFTSRSLIQSLASYGVEKPIGDR
ncbi:unnamed protein product [Camellia sinensis]